jgi:hypothetical protein
MISPIRGDFTGFRVQVPLRCPGPLSLDELWRAYLARFGIEHAIRTLKGTLDLTAAKVRTPEQADRWTRVVIAAHAQLLLARPLTADLRRPRGKAPRPGPAAIPGPGPPRVPQHPPRPGHPGPCPETRPPRTRQAQRNHHQTGTPPPSPR